MFRPSPNDGEWVLMGERADNLELDASGKYGFRSHDEYPMTVVSRLPLE